MGHHGLITKYYKFPFVDKVYYRKFMLNDDIDNFCFISTLIPKDKTEFLVSITSSSLNVFDLFEETLLGTEIETEQFVFAHKGLGIYYESFFPSISIGNLI